MTLLSFTTVPFLDSSTLEDLHQVSAIQMFLLLSLSIKGVRCLQCIQEVVKIDFSVYSIIIFILVNYFVSFFCYFPYIIHLLTLACICKEGMMCCHLFTSPKKVTFLCVFLIVCLSVYLPLRVFGVFFWFFYYSKANESIFMNFYVGRA